MDIPKILKTVLDKNRIPRLILMILGTFLLGLNYNVFTLTTSNYYMYISRINNTLIYVITPIIIDDTTKEIPTKATNT